MIPGPELRLRLRAASRVALSHSVLNGVSVALGLLVISALMHLWLGAQASAAAGLGVIVASPPDLASPRRVKLRQMLPGVVLGVPLFMGVQWADENPLHLGLLLVPATFMAFLAMAWGKRGIPIAVSVMFAMVFSMAAPMPGDFRVVLQTTLHFGIGALAYAVWAVVTNALLNARYRVQFTADTLHAVASLMRAQARQFSRDPGAATAGAVPVAGDLLARHAALADQLQSTRDLVLEAPSTPRRQQLAGLLLFALELRDHLVACELDVDLLRSHAGHEKVLADVAAVLVSLSAAVDEVADALLQFRTPGLPDDLRPRLAALRLDSREAAQIQADAQPEAPAVLRHLADRVGHVNDEVLRLARLARGEAGPDLAIVRANWQMFVSPVAWSIRPFLALWRWDAPPLRHAIRAALAIAAGYIISLVMPWKAHPYWILITIVVVLRGSLSQTLERRNSRVAGTLLGSVLAVGLLAAKLSHAALLGCMTVAQAVAHAFAVRRYLITAVAATVLGLVQAHLLNTTGESTALALVERVADTLLGAGIAWAASYVLPSWERGQIPALVSRTLLAQARHARVSLALGQLDAVDNTPELAWRLARREAYDSLSALVQATQRSLSEPRAAQPPVAALERLQARSYQLLAQLSAVKSMLLLRRGSLQLAALREPLAAATARIEAALAGAPGAAAGGGAEPDPALGPEPRPDPFGSADLTPWLLRRLQLAESVARQLREDAAQALAPPRA